MWDINQIKDIGKRAFQSNYWPSVIVSLVMTAVLGGTGATFSVNSSTSTTTSSVDISGEVQQLSGIIIAAIISAMLVAVAIAVLIRVFLYNPLQVGCYSFFKENVTDGHGSLDEITKGFSNFKRNFITLLLRDLYIALWSILLVVPGVMKAYSYRMVPYILTDEPDLSPSEVLKKSEDMMMGQRMQAFKLDLSFIGWYILAAVSLGLVGVFYAFPWKANVDAALYQELNR